MENFAVIADDFTAAGAWRQARDTADLHRILLELLDDPAARNRLGRAAADLVANRAGATRRMAERVLAERLPD